MQELVQLPLIRSAEQHFSHLCHDGQAQLSFPHLLVAGRRIMVTVLIAGHAGHGANRAAQILGWWQLVVSGKIL